MRSAKALQPVVLSSRYKPVSQFAKVVKQSFGSDPLVIFQGSGFDQDEALKKASFF